jgi:sugar-specific transcriptional regulator TrmB
MEWLKTLGPYVASVVLIIITIYHAHNRTQDRIDERFNKVDERFNKVDERFNKVESRLIGVEKGISEIKGMLKAFIIGK